MLEYLVNDKVMNVEDYSTLFFNLFMYFFCRGKVTVPKGKVITFQGVGNPVLVYGDTASSAGSTQNSASTAILADNFIAKGVVFKVKY